MVLSVLHEDMKDRIEEKKNSWALYQEMTRNFFYHSGEKKKSAKKVKVEMCPVQWRNLVLERNFGIGKKYKMVMITVGREAGKSQLLLWK